MKPPYRLFSRNFNALFMAIAMTGAFLSSPSFAAPSSLTGKLYVSDLKGSIDLLTSDKISTLTKKMTFDADSTTILCAKNSTVSMVYSNGTAMYLGANTRLDIKKFKQEPFTPNRYDLDAEPSVSQTLAHLAQGFISLYTSKLAAGSTMVYTTPQGKFTIQGRELTIEVTGNETRVSVLDGKVTAQCSDSDSGRILEAGQEAVVRSNAASNTSSIISVVSIPADERHALSDLVSLAAIAQKTVYFEMVDSANSEGQTTQEIQASETVPANKPAEFTISPSQLPH